MALKSPTPPTPPTPPTIDKGDGANSNPKIDAPNFFQVPFVRDSEITYEIDETVDEGEVEQPKQAEQPAQTRQVTTPETMARDAVANGAGPLTKRTVTKPETQEQTPKPPQVVQMPQDTGAMSNAERGKAILREFQEEEERLSNAKQDNVRTASESQPVFKSPFNQGEGHGGAFWLLTLILAGVLSFLFVKKYLLRDKPKLKASDLFSDSTERLKSATKNITAKKKTPARLPQKKDDDDKGKHFEVRV